MASSPSSNSSVSNAGSSSNTERNKKSNSSKASSSNNAKNLGMGDKLNKTTVASLLAKSRELAGGANLTSDELEHAERSWKQPELTIEPIFRGLKPDNRWEFFVHYQTLLKISSFGQSW